MHYVVKKIRIGKKIAVIIINPKTMTVVDATYWHTTEGNKLTKMSLTFAQGYINRYPVS